MRDRPRLLVLWGGLMGELRWLLVGKVLNRYGSILLRRHLLNIHGLHTHWAPAAPAAPPAPPPGLYGAVT